MDLERNGKNNIDKTCFRYPKVSVIVATYRRNDALKRALLSLLKQSYENLEIIVVDDNANKAWNASVKDIINDLVIKHNKEIVYIANICNKGSAETRNIGILKASGEYVTFLDDDDIYLIDKVTNQVKNMLSNNADYSVTDLALYDESDRFVEKRVRNFITKIDKTSLLKYHLMYHITGTDCFMFRKDYLLSIGSFPLIDIGDEFYLMKKAIEAGGTMSYLPACDVRAYIHTETDGLSSGERKISGENDLYEHKKMYFDLFCEKEKKYIRMRHFAVLAFTYYRMKKYLPFVLYALSALVSAPVQCTKFLIDMRKR